MDVSGCVALISIHALREEGDQTDTPEQLARYKISIHALREEGDPTTMGEDVPSKEFLSTPSARRATRHSVSSTAFQLDFYPRPPRGGRRLKHSCPVQLFQISIHALREEGDSRIIYTESRNALFLSTPSARRATSSMPSSWWQRARFLSTPSARRATAKTERKPSAFVSLYTSLHKLQRGACKTNRKITPLLVQTAGIPVRSLRENHVRCLFALAGHQKISTLSCANSGCSPTCSTLVW